MAEQSNLGERFAVLQILPERLQPSPPKIQRVSNYLRNRKDVAEYFTPKMVSMGPIHHGDPNLVLGEQLKLIWAAEYIKSTAQTPQVLYKRIEDKFKELKDLFTTDLFTDNKLSNYVSEGFANLEEKLCWMLFVDGCALLQILKKANINKPYLMNVKTDQLLLVMQDVLLLENQLPYLLLKLLWKNNNESKLIKTVKDFLNGYFLYYPDASCEAIQSPTHLLDIYRTFILSQKTHSIEGPEIWIEYNRYRNIQELRKVGIRLKSSHTRGLRDVDFRHGWFGAELRLPEIIVEEWTAASFLNLMAYEMWPDFLNDYGICSFVTFMDSLIDHPDDVKALRYEGILLSSIVSDEEVVKLFHMVSMDLSYAKGEYAHVRIQIHKHCSKKCKIWIGQGLHTHFSNPWTTIAFIAAFVALALTFVQTWYAINPKF